MSKDFLLKYKDVEPVKTISNARNKLALLGIVAQESWSKVGENVYSVHLAVLGTTITANGKGCTKELTLASAYGELIERLSFLLPFRVSPFFQLFYEDMRCIFLPASGNS